jgi:regulator of protease activity HflC (stomatin/prohibitin superfamily)
MNIIKDILDFLRQFWPFEIVYAYQRGVRFWCGKDTAELQPGLYMFVPFFGHIETVNVKTDTLQIQNQNLTTRDGTGISVSANMTYQVVDARAAYVNVQAFVNNIADECRTALATRIRDHDYADLLAEQDDLEAECLETINAAAGEWGVEVIHVGLADFIRTKNLSLTKL